MKNLKKLMSVVLSVVMLMSLAVSTSAATFADVAETDNAYEAIEVLAALEILEGKEAGNFDPEANIKRSEFAAVICRAMNQESAALGAASFVDVTPDHWAYNYIGWAASQEIVNGKGNGKFDPDANVTYSEAIAMIVRALGYEWYVNEYLGGYPGGHARIASSYKIDKNVNIANGNAPATRADVAKLVYNAFNAPLMDVKYISYEPSYVIYDGSKSADYEKRTLLSYYADTYKIRASVVETYRNNLELIAANGDKTIKLNPDSCYGFDEKDIASALNIGYDKEDEELKDFTAIANNDAWANYQGYVVNAYVTVNEKEKPVIVAMVADTTSSEELVIENANKLIDESTIDGEEVTLKYYESAEANKTKKVSMADASDVTLYVNNMTIGTLDEVEAADIFATLEDGAFSSVTLLETDGEYNRIYVIDYQYGIVEKVDTELEVIETDDLVLYLSEDDTQEGFTYNIYKDGAAIELSDLEEGDLLNVVIGATSGDVEDATFVDIYVTNNVIEATVKSEYEGAYSIDGEEYYVVAGSPAADELEPGASGKFFVTIDGYIYGAELEYVTSDNYAFLVQVAQKTTGSMMGEAWQIKLVDKANSIKVYDVASTVYITDVFEDEYKRKSFKTSTSAKDKQSDYFVETAFEYETVAELEAGLAGRLVTFVEKDGEITELIFPVATASKKSDYVVDELTDGLYKEKTGMLDGIEIDETVVLFNVPTEDGRALVNTEEDESGLWSVDENKVQILTVSGLKDKDSYNGFIYNYDEDKNTLGAALLTDNMGFAGNATALAVVKSISDGLDAENESAKLVRFFQAGEEKELVISRNSDEAGVEALKEATAGDVFQYTVNAAGEINTATIIYDYNAGEGALLEAGDDDVKYVAGVVSGNTTKVLTLGVADEDGYAWNLEDGCTNVLFDTDKRIQTAFANRTGTSYIKAYSEIKSGDNEGDYANDAYVVVARLVDDVVADVVVYVYDKPEMTPAEFEAEVFGGLY